MNMTTTVADNEPVLSERPGFFRRIDWAAFWSATAISFLVYFFTLGPSVGLEDSGELATAADHLGVPHPPGYPFWSLCGWFFCRVFSWVTYMGHPTPAWAMSLFSAVAGALAAGCTAMLICRSGSDMLDSMDANRAAADVPGAAAPDGSANALLSFAAGVGASLVFAFSPVEWSQATIVEIYALNALFLMAVFLLTYRWMRKPSDKILWLTAFIFGLGLTNYQVLLLAAVPLAIVIALKDIRLFRDFVLILIPVGLTAKVLQIGSMLRANRYMSAEVINKFEPLRASEACPNEWVLGLGLALVILAPLVGLVLARRGRRVTKPMAATGFAGVALMLLAATLFAGKAEWLSAQEQLVAPLLAPAKYAWIGAFLAASCVASLPFAFNRERKDWRWLGAAIACGAVAILIAASGPSADAAGYRGEAFAWGKPTLLLIGGLVALFALALSTPRGLAYAVPVASVQLAAFILLAKGGMNGLTNPHSWWFLWPIFWNFAIITLAAVTLPCGKSIAPAMFFAELGVSFYAYMPIVSDLRNPPMNWGYPRTWEGFKHAIMRGQYEAIKMPDFFSADGFALFLKQMGFYFQDLRMQFTLVAAALALVPFALWRATFGNRRLNMAWIAAGLYAAVAALVIVFSELCEGLTGGEVPLRLDKLLLLVLALLALAGVALMAVRQTRVVCAMVRGRKETVAAGGKFAFLMDDVSQQWLIAVGACFGLMSLFLVALAGVKGDIQDGFIQKVKFISSHGMFSLWIGYGLLVGGTLVRRVLLRAPALSNAARPVTYALMAVMAALALIPVYENYTNDKLVFAMGSAEQNGHTFGWQFGAYQLEGANEIRDELARAEEPLPNPLWPERMEDHAIFFGGTDPGRFVPTYMIYSADFRPDVYLITQNALADDTYMSVERDLYGDEIWIPAKEDSAESFNIYVNEVQSGKRPANADLKIENGRVQVTGALGVMEINGVLTKMMFDHERLRHAFYVEESYVIPWMYEYLSPHGLIMKINRDKNPLTPAISTNDMEFWDWYLRRLLHDKAFRRDFPAQKSFSKLRAAIAGLYANRGHYREAARAFAEASLLYPASPEATFRYIQEILLPMRRWDAALDLLAYTDRVDPNNARTRPMRDYITRIQAVTARIANLGAKDRAGKATPQEQLDLAQDYLSIGQTGQAVALVRKLLARPESAKSFDVKYFAAHILSRAGQRGDAANCAKEALALLPPNAAPDVTKELGTVFAAGGMHAEAIDAFNAYLQTAPGAQDAEAWLALCRSYAEVGRIRESQQAFIRAYGANKDFTMAKLQGDENLQKIAAPLFRQQ